MILFHNSWTLSWSYQWETDFKYTYIPVYYCSVHNNQKLEIASMSINGWVDSENVACLHNRIYSPVKKKKKEHVRKTEGPGHYYSKQGDPDSERQKPPALPDTWLLALTVCVYTWMWVWVRAEVRTLAAQVAGVNSWPAEKKKGGHWYDKTKREIFESTF